MSAVSSDKKNSVFNEANEALYDAFQAVELPQNFPTDPPWPEWDDADVNAETWGNGTKRISQASTKPRGTIHGLAAEFSFNYYVDPEPGKLPPDLEKFICSWKRPHEIFPVANLSVYEENTSPLSLNIPSEIAANCELFKAASDIYRILHFYAAMELFPTEYETAHFIPNTRGQPWQPWHHVYGSCKITKDQLHSPLYTPYGKYILRLYYLGAWRKFIVDDQIPCDASGKCMLPMTQKPGELWPILLMKGILKIAALTPTSHLDLMNIPLWTLFTGWIFVVYPTPNNTINQTWRLVYAMCPQYILREDKVEAVSGNLSSKSLKETMKKKDTGEEEGRPVLIIADLEIIFPESEYEKNSYLMPLLMTREEPLVKARRRKSTEQWKRIRWVHWAENKGIWVDEEQIPPFRCIMTINISSEANKLLKVDPKIENRLFILEETPCEEEENGPSIWVDFYKFLKYLKKINLLIKPSSLKSRCRMSYINFGVQEEVRVTTVKPNVTINNAEPITYYMLPTVRFSGNESPIVYCESASEIFISFSLWVCPQKGLDNDAYLSVDQPEFLSVYRGSLIVEEYDWRLAKQNVISLAFKTVGNKNSHIFLNPGRHALRLWLDTDSQFIIDVHSNTELTVGKGPKIRFAMSTESILVTEYVNSVSEAFFDLVKNFGTRDQNNISQFFMRIKPRNSIVQGYEHRLKYFLDAFSLSILTVLHSLITNEDELYWMGKALRSLFLNPFIPCPVPKPRPSTMLLRKKTKIHSSESHERDSVFLIPRDWTDEEMEKAITIQRIYRGFVVRQLLRNQSPGNKDYKLMVEKLKKIGDLMFAPSKRDIEVARLIRETVATEPALLPTFLFHRDLANVTVTEEFTGKIPGVEPNAWVPMIRFTFACHSQKPLPCAFYYSCNLKQYTVTVTDNDTNEEIFRLINTTSPHYYTRNETGYTLFVYGWNESDQKTVYWRLEMVKMKYFLDIHPCDTTLTELTGNSCHPYQPQTLSMQELRNFYVPNKRNKICTCLLKVRKRILVTIRFSVSFEDARFCARITRRSGNNDFDSDFSSEGRDLVIEAEAKSSAVIFPTVLLDHDMEQSNENDQTEYLLEAFVIYNSWPLTKHEWGVVELIRMNGETWQEERASIGIGNPRKSTSVSRRKSVRAMKSSTAAQKVIESPYWYLQIVTNSSHDPGILEAAEDRSYQDVIKSMKTSWEENDPGRRLKGKTIRYEFLRAIYEGMTQTHSEPDKNASDTFETTRPDNDSVYEVTDSFDSLVNELNSVSYLLNEKSNTRYLKSQRIIPWTPMSQLFEKYSCGKYESKVNSTIMSLEGFQGEDYVVPEERRRTEEIFQEEKNKFLSKMRRQRLLLEEHMARENALSMQLMKEAYEGRRKIINDIDKKKKLIN